MESFGALLAMDKLGNNCGKKDILHEHADNEETINAKYKK